MGIRNHLSVDEDAGLKLDILDMLAVAPGILADFWVAPRVDRDSEGSTRRDAWNEAGHNRHPDGALTISELDIGDDLAVDPELLERRRGASSCREEKDIPVFVPHDDDDRRGAGCDYGATI